jgi:hypothetical protein
VLPQTLVYRTVSCIKSLLVLCPMSEYSVLLLGDLVLPKNLHS